MSDALAEYEWCAQEFHRIISNVSQFIRGKSGVIQLALICMVAEGHILVEDVPGVGKTSLAKALAASVNGRVSRIQFTADLLPTDITGVQLPSSNGGSWEFRPGPIFANIVVADEINRASPKAQSALLEVMEERQITVDGVTHATPRPFVVIATQNPVETLAGTYPLPEAQIDRFMMRMSVGYPDHAAEIEVLQERSAGASTASIRPVSDVATVTRMAQVAANVHVSPDLHDYVVKLTSATRQLDGVRLGVSPRGSLALIQASQAFAASQGRSYVSVDDIKRLAPYVLSHRLMLTTDAELESSSHGVLAELLAALPLPAGSR